MSAKEMIEASSYSGNLVVEGDGGKSWLLVVSKLGEKKILIDTSLFRGWGTYFNITELWPYFSGYVKGCPVQMGVMSHDVELSDSYLSCNVDSIKRNLLWNENQNTTMIKNVYGQMYLKNNTDSVVYLSSSTKKHYAVVDGQDSYGDTSMGTRVYYTRDKNSVEWQNWKASHDAWQAEYDAAVEEYNAAVDSDNQALTSEEESNINFYEKLFTAIAEKGWVANSQIEDNDYLNNMLQNNQYYITTMEEQTDSDGKSYFEYSQDIASNFENVFSVNDTDAQNEALIDYEYEKSVINEKETRIDTRMQNLETEQSAINEMIKGIETVRNDNTERTFGIFA